ncbi:MAG: glycosyltransferase family 2 protein [Spirochaetales bacterium]
MQQNYQIVSRSGDITRLINGLHREEILAIGIMDTGSTEELEESVQWFSDNYNHGLHVITQSDRMSQTGMEDRFPDVTFIVFDKAPSLAERINALANTCGTTYFLVTRSDINLVEFNFADLNSLMKAVHPAMLTPLIFNKSKELIPTVRAPHMDGNSIDPMSFMPSTGIDDNLYPFLGLGLYDRALFQRLRGFDEELTGAYWQALDFGTRCWLYGYPILSVNSMAVFFYSKQFLIEDRSENESCDRYYTKALSVKFIKDRLILKKAHKANKRVFVSEVKPRAGLYRTDFQTLCEKWRIPQD